MQTYKRYSVLFAGLTVMSAGLMGWSVAVRADGGKGKSTSPPPAPSSTSQDPDPAPGTMPETARLEKIAGKRPADKTVHLLAARHYLEESYGAESRLVDASRHVNAVLSAEPRNFEALMLAGDIANRQRQPSTAAAHYRNATLANPDSKEALLALSGALEQSGDHAGADEALAKFRKLSGMPPMPGAEAKPGEAKKNEPNSR